jgi:hypothetical protein
MVLGAMMGGFVAVQFIGDPSNVAINPKTIAQLAELMLQTEN